MLTAYKKKNLSYKQQSWITGLLDFVPVWYSEHLVKWLRLALSNEPKLAHLPHMCTWKSKQSHFPEHCVLSQILDSEQSPEGQ